MKRIQLSNHFKCSTLLLFALPSIGMQIVDNTYQIADGYFISNFIGEKAFEAENLIFPPLLIVMSVGLMFGTGASALIAKELGEGRKERANRLLSMVIAVLAAAAFEEIGTMKDLLLSVKEQVAEGIAHCSWDFMSETRQPYVNDCMEVNLQLGINADELDEMKHELIELQDEFSAAGARLEMELLENEFGDGGFDSEMEYAEGLFDRERMEAFHDLYMEILERMILTRDESL